MGVLTGAPTHDIQEHSPGYQKYDEKALRQGVRNWLADFGKVRPTIISLGNEPHGDDARVQESMKAYRIVYDEVKKIDPRVIVLATSSGPEERYFKYGVQDCCDAYDFHIYESYVDVRRAIETYHKLFKKYGGEKPIWSTELGLNAQGMTRQAVAVEMVKKFAVFFAAGGQKPVVVRPALSGRGGHAGQRQLVGLQRLRLPLLPLRAEAGRGDLLQHGQRDLHQEIRRARSSTPGESTRISSATATGSACRSSGPTRAAPTWACPWPAWRRWKPSASMAAGPR